MKLNAAQLLFVLVAGAIVFLATKQFLFPYDPKAYSTEKFNAALDRDQLVFITFASDWDGSAKYHNMLLSETEEWNQFFDSPSNLLMFYNRTQGIKHEELADLKDGAANGLLAIYSRKLGPRPLITPLGHLEVGHLEEMTDFIELGDGNELVSVEQYETKLIPGKIFARDIPRGAKGLDPR